MIHLKKMVEISLYCKYTSNAKRSNMKIAFIVSGNHLAGGNFVIYRHAKYLRSIGHEVHLLFVRLEKTKRIYFPDFDIPSYFLSEVASKGVFYDLAIATWWETFYFLHRVNAGQYLYFCQSDERRFYSELPNRDRLESRSLLVGLTYRFRNIGIVTEARWIKDLLESEFHSVVEYAPNGVDLGIFNERVQPLAEREANKLRFLVEGPGSVAFKRVDHAFNALKPFRDQIEVWYISGDGFCNPLWRPDRFFSSLSMRDMAPVYRSCDVLIKLSVVEGVFGPPLEMMACGNTAIVSDVTGFDEYIKHGKNALVVAMDDLRGTQATIGEVIRSGRNGLRSLCKVARETATKMNWERQHPLFERAILKLAKRVPKVTPHIRGELAALEKMKYALDGIPTPVKPLKKKARISRIQFLP